MGFWGLDLFVFYLLRCSCVRVFWLGVGLGYRSGGGIRKILCG